MSKSRLDLNCRWNGNEIFLVLIFFSFIFRRFLWHRDGVEIVTRRVIKMSKFLTDFKWETMIEFYITYMNYELLFGHSQHNMCGELCSWEWLFSVGMFCKFSVRWITGIIYGAKADGGRCFDWIVFSIPFWPRRSMRNFK